MNAMDCGRCVLTVWGLVTGGAFQASSQTVTLQVANGAGWSSTANVPADQSMSFRWTHSGSTSPTRAVWQVSYAANPSATDPRLAPTVVESVVPRMPTAAGQFVEFGISPRSLPPGRPTVIHVRVRSDFGRTMILSPWVPVSTLVRDDIGLPNFTCATYGLIGTAAGVPAKVTSSVEVPGFCVVCLSFEVEVMNHGQRGSNLTLAMVTTVDGVRDIFASQTGQAPAGQSAHFWFSSQRTTEVWNTQPVHKFTARAVVDPNNLVRESNESDNSCERSITMTVKP